MNTNLDYAFYTENFEIYKFQFKTYGMGMWYDPKLNSYDEIIELIKEHIYEKVQKDNPHLIMLKPHADEVIQVDNGAHLNANTAEYLNQKSKDFHAEKINKGTIEEQIQEMKSYKLGAGAFKAVYSSQVKGNVQLEEAYKIKLAELEGFLKTEKNERQKSSSLERESRGNFNEGDQG